MLSIINSLQALQSFLNFLQLLGFVLALISPVSLNELFNTHNAGLVIFTIGNLAYSVRAIMSSLMAVLRLIYVVCPQWLSNFGPKRMGGFFIPAALFLIIFFQFFGIFNPIPHNFLINVADDRSMTKAKIIMTYQQIRYEESMFIQKVVLLVGIGFHVSELTCYIIIFIYLYFHDRSMRSLLSERAYMSRKRSNAITLISQFALFLVEICGLCLLVLRQQYPHHANFINIVANYINVPISVVTILASRPLRKILFDEIINPKNNQVSAAPTSE